MRNEEVLIVMKDLCKQIEILLNNRNKTDNLVESLIQNGLMFEKQVGKFAKKEAHILVPRRLLGKTFRVLMIPSEDLWVPAVARKRSSFTYPANEEVKKADNRAVENIKPTDGRFKIKVGDEFGKPV
jgi:putative transposon-encoded protein